MLVLPISSSASSCQWGRSRMHVDAHLRGDELGKRLGVEAGVGKAQAAVHGVGGELERLLPDLQLLAAHLLMVAAGGSGSER